MPLYTVYLALGRWAFGRLVCMSWLSVDYTVSNASVANLLLICVDRYLSITRPLTYRPRRTGRRVRLMVAAAWLVSALLWPPWIFGIPLLEGAHSLPLDFAPPFAPRLPTIMLELEFNHINILPEDALIPTGNYNYGLSQTWKIKNNHRLYGTNYEY